MSGEFPHVVYVHSREHGDFAPVFKNAGLEAPLQITSFTDTHPDTNPHNAKLEETVQGCDVLVIERSLLLQDTETSRVAFGAMTRIREQARRVILVDELLQVCTDSAYAGIPAEEVVR
jgi:hypothetical protein